LAVLWSQISLYGKCIDLPDKPYNFKCTWLAYSGKMVQCVPQGSNPGPTCFKFAQTGNALYFVYVKGQMEE